VRAAVKQLLHGYNSHIGLCPYGIVGCRPAAGAAKP